MEISYDETEDILFIRFNDEPIVRDISYGWHVNVGMTETGIGQITILEANRFIYRLKPIGSLATKVSLVVSQALPDDSPSSSSRHKN